jgi:hypothetical protein
VKINLIKQQKFLPISLLFLMAFSLNNCKNSKAVNQGDNTQVEKQMLSDGFHKGAIVDYSAEKGCTFLIKREETGELLLPYKLEDQFMQNNLEVWFKYGYSRRVQGDCLKGITITLGEIKIRN